MKLILGVTLFVTCSCSVVPPGPSDKPPVATLPPVRLNMERGTYYLPECELYDGLVDRVRLEVPTVQEAELSGYHAGACPEGLRDARLAAERQRYGEMRATQETQERRDRLNVRRALAWKVDQ